MSLRQAQAPYGQGEAPARAPADDSDAEEETMVNDYRQQLQQYDDGMEELDRTTSVGTTAAGDIQQQLAAAATPLEYQATLETKFASYDNYCSLFHYILNSEGPVDLEVPSVSGRAPPRSLALSSDWWTVLLGVGCDR
jgi:translation initiation factor 3 subunit L